MRRRRGDRTPMYAEVNVVSLVDLMMLLMVIFMITAPIMQGGVDLALPKTDARAVDSKGGTTISVLANGAIFVDDERLTLAEFRASFRALISRKADQGVYFRGDQRAPYGIVVQVLDIVKNAGVTNVALVTEPEDVSK
ncbi:MAG TPA: biopolymer transporter ExbD [Gemmatimonadaceae bacterium]|nr:biopolymer transporter ExbD [Gemmatimonadaceae bacterium]